MLEGTGNLSVSVIVGQIRSTATDLLAATGMSYDQSAGAVRDAVRAAEDALWTAATWAGARAAYA